MVAEKAQIKLDEAWLSFLRPEFDKPYMQNLREFLRAEKESGAEIYPRGNLIFNALNITKLHNVRVVILGQDPYHGFENGMPQAHGLSFSVPQGVHPPPSLKNIFKEIELEFGAMPKNADLTAWAQQGVLLLNSVLTVRAHNAASHAGKGWEIFTDKIIKLVNAECDAVVFMLWGAYAQKKENLIDAQKHLVLKAPHPSPLSAHRGFLGCGHFKKANEFLKLRGLEEIEWV